LQTLTAQCPLPVLVFQQRDIRIHHHLDELLEADLRRPTELRL